MEEEKIENADSLNDGEITPESEVEVNEDNTPTLEDFLALKEEKQKLEETNKKLYARLKSPQNLTKKPSNQMDEDISQKFEKLELKTEGYNDDEIDFLSQYGGKKALENPIIKTALDTLREKAKAEKAVVDTSENTSTIEKKYTEAQLKSMSPTELEELIRSSK
jgi:hypothetical protein